MSLLFMDGFDTRANKWTAGNPSFNGSLMRTGVACMELQRYPLQNVWKAVTAGDVFIVGGALNWGTFSTQEAMVFTDTDGSTQHIVVSFTGAGYLVIKRGATVLATATSHQFSPNAWYYLEVKVVIHDTTGSVEVHVDTETVAFSASLTGIDTRNGSTGVVGYVSLGGTDNAFGHFGLWDDVYICDDAGSINNNFLGICVVETLWPQLAAAGTHQDFTPSTGTDHAANVDEAIPNGDTDYNSSATVGHQDSYNYPSLALTGSILGIQTSPYAKKTDAGVRTIASIVRVAGTTTPGTTVSPTTAYQYFPQVWESKPAGGAWSSADIAALEVGLKIVS